MGLGATGEVGGVGGVEIMTIFTRVMGNGGEVFLKNIICRLFF